MTVKLDRPNSRLLIRPEAPKAVDFEVCQAYLRTRGVTLVDIYDIRDLSKPAYWIVATESGHELSRGLTWDEFMARLPEGATSVELRTCPWGVSYRCGHNIFVLRRDWREACSKRDAPTNTCCCSK